MNMQTRAQQLIDLLQLQPHPEGGWYREVFRSNARVRPEAEERFPRAALTTIYFLLEAHQHSRWHRVTSDEVWVHLEGAPITLWTCDAALRTAPAHVRLGLVDAHGTRPQHIVPAGQWQAARLLATHGHGDFALAACTVAPGFDFADFSMMPADSEEAALMRHHWPDLAGMI